MSLRDSARKVGIAAAFALSLLLPATVASQASAAPPSGFEETVAFSGLVTPTAIAFSPDGRVFVAEQNGRVYVYDGLGDSEPTLFRDLRTEVHSFWDRGLLGLALDPGFPQRPYVYVLYARDAALGGNPPRWGQPNTDSDPCPSATGNGCVISGRLSRLTASGNTVVAETPLITDWCQQFPSHSTGDLAFGADGALYVSGGEGASFTEPDWGQFGDPVNPCGDPPGGPGTALSPPTAEGGALRAQDARTTADPTGLSGTILRVNPDTGLGLPGNPFFGDGDANRARIAAFGERNPFRITVRPGTNEVWSGNVGWNVWEEINRLTEPTGGPENFGWPCYDGSNTGSARHGFFDDANLNLCESLYSLGAGAVTAPYYAYDHLSQVVAGESCPSGNSAISGLDFYVDGPFPNAYNGALFFSDWARDCIWAMMPGPDGLPDKTRIQTFNPGAANPVDLEVGPQGDLFYADLGGGTIRRISHIAAPRRCRGRVATVTGTKGRDKLRGTRAVDVIVALGGRDDVRGRGGADVICGAGGPDRLAGGGGADRLLGGGGRDRLAGGAGADRCLGGPGADRGKACEKGKSLLP
jgi:glucose/arabinose dehydrogenase